MAALGGFESAPRLAVGVSGGADSLALALLAKDWVAARGGTLLALTVDHGLREAAAAEAAAVGAWLAGHGIAHGVLRWEGAKPGTGVQEAAREARRRLLMERCRAEGILHLLLAHHRGDQAETLLLRLAGGSGVDGLAAMAPVRWEAALRLLRPLLDIDKSRLEATCRARSQPWIDDPSNRSPAFARARLRAAADALAAAGLTAPRLADTAGRAGRARHALDLGTAGVLALAAEIFPEGWVRLDPAPLLEAPAELGLRALARVLATVGGEARGPRGERLERLFAEVCRGLASARTLGGCLVRPARGGCLAISREAEAAAGRCPLAPGEAVLWDGRFTVRLDSAAPDGLVVARLGGSGRDLVAGNVPAAVRAAMPGLWRGNELFAVPRTGGEGRYDGGGDASAEFTPAMPLAGPAFPVVKAGRCII
jgi:tRNA(Ile)-lysidine synthase